MRNTLTAASLSACLVTACFVGCGEKSQEKQVSEKIDVLLEEVSQLKYADAPLKNKQLDGKLEYTFDNKLEYTFGKEIDGVKVPGSTSFEAAYLDQAVALLPLAEEILKDGTPLQRESANAIIGSIRTDEAAFLIDEAERSLQSGVNDVIALRDQISRLRGIAALKNAVAGDRLEVIETYQTGLNTGGTTITGITQLREAAATNGSQAEEATSDLAQYNAQIDDLRESVADYEALELKLMGQARSAQSTAKYDRLDQASSAAKEAETAQANAQRFEIDAWLSERAAILAEFKRQQLAGDKQSSTAQLMGKLEGYLTESATETNVSTSSDTYTILAQALEQAKTASSDEVLQAAAFLLSMSAYATAEASDDDQRAMLSAAMDKRISGYLGVIGLLEMKIAQIRLNRQRAADKLAENESDRQQIIQELIAGFDKHDKMLQAAGFARMRVAIERLDQAEAAVQGSGNDNEMDLMSVYLLHARALHQQSVSAQLYYTTLSSIAEAGPELLGEDLHTAVSGRATAMQNLLAAVKTEVLDLQGKASDPAAAVQGLGQESDRGQIATRQLELYNALMTSLGAAPAGTPSTGDTTPATPAAGGTEDTP